MVKRLPRYHRRMPRKPQPEPPESHRVRLDKWLWAARFFKTRSLAQDAIEGGKVRLAGERVKSSREVRVGDEVRVNIDGLEWCVEVLQLSEQRGPASVARQLYIEAAESIAAREAAIELRRVVMDPGASIHGRPTKKDRRLIHRFTE